MLSKENRIRLNADFEKIFVHGERHYSGGALLFTRKNNLSHSHIACVIGKKFHASAVKRNRQKRIFLDIMASTYHRIAPGYDIVISYTNHGKMLPYKESLSVISMLLQKARLLH